MGQVFDRWRREVSTFGIAPIFCRRSGQMSSQDVWFVVPALLMVLLSTQQKDLVDKSMINLAALVYCTHLTLTEAKSVAAVSRLHLVLTSRLLVHLI